jgi:hypothetical protein
MNKIRPGEVFVRASDMVMYVAGEYEIETNKHGDNGWFMSAIDVGDSFDILINDGFDYIGNISDWGVR